MSHAMRLVSVLGIGALLAAAGGCATSTSSLSGVSDAPAQPTSQGLAIIRANSFTMSSQGHAALARVADGSHVVVWDSRKQQDGYYGVYGRVVSADGEVLAPETQLNVNVENAQMLPAVAAAPDGSVWVAWQSFDQDGQGWGVIARRLGSDLATGTPEILVNETRDGQQAAPVIAVGAEGRVLVAWSSEAELGGPTRAMARVFAPDGKPLTGEFELGTAGAKRETTISVAALAGGGFAAAWTSVDADGRNRVSARVFEGLGVPLTSEIVAAEGVLDQLEPGLAADDAGGFAVSWLSGRENGWAVAARSFDGNGTARGEPVVMVDADDGLSRYGATLAHVSGAEWFVAHNERGESVDVVARRVNLETGALGELERLAGVSEDDQKLAAMTGATRLIADADGSYALAWEGQAGLGDGSGAHLTIRRPGLAAMTWAPEGEATETTGVIAVPHIPPIKDPNFVPRQPLVMFGSDNGDFGFNALGFSGLTPPDPDLAVGPGGLVATANAAIAFFEKDGTQTFSQNIDDFFQPAGAFGFIFDPEALYDEHDGRFWVMANERASNQSYFLVAVSDDDNPEGTWFKYRLLVSNIPGIGGDIDSPNFAVDDEFVYLTADFFTPGTRFLIFNVDKTPLLSGLPAPSGTNIVNFGTQSFGIPQHNDLSAPRQYLIETTEFSTNTVVRLHAINDPGGAPSLTTFTLPVAAYQFPGNPPQQGTGISPFLFEPRVWSCEYIDGSLWAVHHIREPGKAQTLVRWYEIEMNGWPTSGQDPSVKQFGSIDAGPGVHAYFPSIGANAQGDAAITFSRSSTQEFISMWRVLRRAADPLGTFGPMELVKESAGPDTSGRWGDYSQTRFEPSKPCVFWGHNEWQPGGLWNTWIASYMNGSPADVNEDCVLDVLDFLAFQALFEAQDPKADVNGDGVFNILDFTAFQVLFQQG